jgi:hypothetical protein
MFIVIYRTKAIDVSKVFEELAESISSEIDSNIKINKNWLSIGIENARIDFRCGEVYKLGGLIPDYYNTDSQEASDFLKCGADKVNGKEIKDISGIIDIIKKMEEHKWK